MAAELGWGATGRRRWLLQEVLVSQRGRAWGGVAQHEGSIPGTVSKVEGRKVHTLIDLSA
jgi:hypothetical protein